MFDVLAMYALFSLPFTFGKAALQYVQPLFFVGTRMLVAGSIMLGYQYCFDRSRFVLHKKDWSLFAQAIVFQMYIMYVCQYWSLQYMTSGKSALIFALAPFITALCAYFICAEKMTTKKIIGLSIGFAGFLPVLLTDSAQEHALKHFGLFSIAELAALIAVFGYAYGWIIAKKLINERGYAPMMINGVSMFFASFLTLGTSPFIDVWNPLPYTDTWQLIKYVVLLVVISNMICYNWYVSLLRKYTATFVSFAGFTEPMFVAAYSWVLLGEVVTWDFYLSLCIIFIGLYIFYQEELRQGYIKSDCIVANQENAQ